MSKLFKMTLVQYNNYPMFEECDRNHERPRYIEKARFELPPMEFDNLYDAEEWLFVNFPNHCIGFFIGEVDDWRFEPVRGGDFCADACLDEYVYYHGKDLKETYRKVREMHLRNIKKWREEDEAEDLLDGIPEEDLKAAIEEAWEL